MENLPMTSCGRVTRAQAKKLEGGMTPSGPATAPKTGAKGAASAAATPQVLFQDVTNTTRKKQPASSKKVLQEACKEPAAPERSDSDVTAWSTETVKGSFSELASGAGSEEQQAASFPAEGAQQVHFDQHAQVQQPAGTPQPALTPERAPQQPTHMCLTASKAEQGQGLATSKTPCTTVKQDAATPALKKPEVEATPATAAAAVPSTGPTPGTALQPAARTLEKQVSITTPKEPKSATLARPVVCTPYPKPDSEALAREEAEETAQEAAAAETAQEKDTPVEASQEDVPVQVAQEGAAAEGTQEDVSAGAAQDGAAAAVVAQEGPAAAEAQVQQAEDTAMAAEDANTGDNEGCQAGSELYGEVRDEQGQPIGAVEYAGSEFNRGLEEGGSDMASPMPLTMSPASPVVWSCAGTDTPATGSAAATSPSMWSMDNTPAGGSTAAPTPAGYTMHAGATPGAGKSTAAPSPAMWTMPGATPATGSTVAPSPSVWSMAADATPLGAARDQDTPQQVPGSQFSARTHAMSSATPLGWARDEVMAQVPGSQFSARTNAMSSATPLTAARDQDMTEVPGSQFSARTCAMSTAPRFGGYRESDDDGNSGDDGVEEQVPAGALESLVSAEAMLARAQARMSSVQPPAYPEDQAAAAPAASEPVRPRLKSKVVASEKYDPRSLAQIKREIKEAELKKKASATASKEAEAQAAQVQNLTDVRTTPLVDKADYYEGEEEVEDSEAYHEDEEAGDDTAVDDQLMAAMGGLGIRPAGPKPEALKGLPLPRGTHIRFDDEGTAMDSPTSGKPALRGLPQATGAHIRFD